MPEAPGPAGLTKRRVAIVEDDNPTRGILVEVIKSAAELELVSQYGESEVAAE